MRFSLKSVFVVVVICALSFHLVRIEIEFMKLQDELRSLSCTVFKSGESSFLSLLLPSKGSYSVRVDNLTQVVTSKLIRIDRIHSMSIRSFDSNKENFSAIAKFTQLRDLDLSGSQITDAGLCVVLQIPSLERLDLSNTVIGDDGVQLLKETKLKSLCLNETNVTNIGIETISELSCLEDLEVNSSSITYIGLMQLEGKPVSKSLRRILIFQDYYNDAGKSELNCRLPFCSVVATMEQKLPLRTLSDSPFNSTSVHDDPFTER